VGNLDPLTPPGAGNTTAVIKTQSEVEMNDEMIDVSPGSRNGEFQGNVKLCVEGADSAQMVISFVNTLRQKPCVRVREIAGTVETGVDIRLELRKPMHFISALRQIEGVSKVQTSRDEVANDEEPSVFVQLAVLTRPG